MPLSRLLREADALLLDFDGPICSVFSAHPAREIAAQLVHLLGVDAAPELSDPLDVLRLADETSIRAVEDALCAAELRAVQDAAPTPYGRDVIEAAGLPIAVITSMGEVLACLVGG